MDKDDVYFSRRQNFSRSPSPKRKEEIANCPKINVNIGLEKKFTPGGRWQEKSAILQENRVMKKIVHKLQGVKVNISGR